MSHQVQNINSKITVIIEITVTISILIIKTIKWQNNISNCKSGNNDNDNSSNDNATDNANGVNKKMIAVII